MNWLKPQVIGELPPPLFKHSAALVGSKTFVFGGVGPSNVPYKEHKEKEKDAASATVTYLDTDWNSIDRGFGGGLMFMSENFAWVTRPVTGSIPPSRGAHTTTAIGDKIYLFGGGYGQVYFNDLYILDTKSMSWSKPNITGDSNGKPVNELWAFDTEKNSWSSIVAKDPPSPRGYHSATAVGTKLVIFGGTDTKECFSDVYVMDTERKAWSKAKIVHPFVRFAHTATLVGPWLIVFGGHDGVEYCHDVRVLHLDTLEWMYEPVLGEPPARRGYHVTVFHDSRLWTFGGTDGATTFNDINVLELAYYSFLPFAKKALKI